MMIINALPEKIYIYIVQQNAWFSGSVLLIFVHILLCTEFNAKRSALAVSAVSKATEKFQIYYKE